MAKGLWFLRNPFKNFTRKSVFYTAFADLYSSLAQSVERMTVNHDVAGSSPAGGAKKYPRTKVRGFYFLPIHFSLFPENACQILGSNKGEAR